jgi:hypothetical protein
MPRQYRHRYRGELPDSGVLVRQEPQSLHRLGCPVPNARLQPSTPYGGIPIAEEERQCTGRARGDVAEEFQTSASATVLPAICLPQLQWLAAHESAPSATATRTASCYVVGALLRRQAAAISPHAEDMQRHVLKRDGTRRALIADEEVQAVHRAIAFFAGERSESI